MIENIKEFMYEKKYNIGFFHAFMSILFSFILAFLSSMFLSTLISGDNALKIIPFLILTPIFINFLIR